MKSNPLWWKSAVFYELYVDTFAGDFKRLGSCLDYFSRLGIDCLHILPPYPSPMVDDGYDISDHQNVRPELGTLNDCRAFIQSAHARGIRVMTDLVLNHVSKDHPWFSEARRSRNNTKRDYFLWSDTGKDLAGSVNAFPHLKSSNWIVNKATGDYYFTTFYPEQPDLNWDNPEVTREMCAVIDFWIEVGVDAFRIDAASHLVKREGTNSKGLPETHAVLKKIRAHVNSRDPVVALLAEVRDTPARTRNYFGAGDECQLVYHFPMAEEMFLAALHNDPKEAELLFAHTPLAPANCQWVLFLRNHDELSMSMMTAEQMITEDERHEMIDYCDPSRRFVFKDDAGICMRMASIFKRDPAKIRLAFQMLLGFPASAVIYYGEEIGMENDESLGVVLDCRRYVRGKFDWKRAHAEMRDPNSLFSFVAGLIARKKAHSVPMVSEADTL